MQETYTLTIRELKKWLSRRGTFIVSLVTPLFWLGLFGKSLNFATMFTPTNIPPQYESMLSQYINSQLLSMFGTTSYFTYLASGMLVVFGFFQSVFGGTNLVFEKRLGYLNRLLMTPVSRSGIFLSKVLGTLVRILFYETVLILIAYGLGFRFKPGINAINIVLAGIAIILIAIGFVSIFAAIAFNVDNVEIMFAIVNLINLPLMFASSALFPLKQMPSWLQEIAKFNPITYAADIVRHNLVGTPINNYAISWVILIVITVVLFIVGLIVSINAMERA
ncbi:MAG: ABC transporter permease [Caldisphaera sp.]|nr:MAG: ABC transporter permease [Caldisphaera sp.]